MGRSLTLRAPGARRSAPHADVTRPRHPYSSPLHPSASRPTSHTASCYNLPVKDKPLIETNPHLRDPVKFRKALITSVASSTAIETGAPIATIARKLEKSGKSLTKKRGSAR